MHYVTNNKFIYRFRQEQKKSVLIMTFETISQCYGLLPCATLETRCNGELFSKASMNPQSCSLKTFMRIKFSKVPNMEILTEKTLHILYDTENNYATSTF